MSISESNKHNADVSSSDEGASPKLSQQQPDANSSDEETKSKAGKQKDDESELSSFSSDEEDTKKSRKSKKKDDDLAALDSFDPFASGALDPFAEKKESGGVTSKIIHIRIQQRNARKSTTTLQGLPEEFDLKKLVKYFKKTYGCLGTVVKDKDHGKVIQLGGDQRAKLSEFLISEGIAKKNEIKVHGF
ncbi:Eukaryotic translation initiation factor eIF-1 [Coemansia sp. RSA 2706]|nr:Eukaryotic translation initiation factor eIF-1 [Coemansia sp. RSA 2711]KAJ2308252.1 Eukaryotic translation initiation factor eIF-1 [Coemansia sp. RSA 2706]KAJ2320807.1 Eukaryotic translation initiation factor eIF-1 [Coemansia sp. RSA 2704]